MLQKFGDNIWIGDGSTLSVAGFDYSTRMAVIRLSTGDLFIWSPIAISNVLLQEVAALGAVRHIVAPNALHHMFIAEWKDAFPQARLYAPPKLRKKRPDLSFDDDLGEAPNPYWEGEIDQVQVNGNLITTEIVFFHIESCTVLFTDLVQQFPPKWHKGWRAIVAKLDLMVGSEPTVPRKFRVAMTGRKLARSAISKILEWPAQKVLMAHGTPVEYEAQSFLKRAFRWLV